MKRVGIIADEIVEALFKARGDSNDPDFENIWMQKVVEVANRNSRKDESYAETTRQSS